MTAGPEMELCLHTPFLAKRVDLLKLEAHSTVYRIVSSITLPVLNLVYDWDTLQL